MAALRALVVLPFPLHAEGGAAARCAIGLMRGLATHDVEVRALCADSRSRPAQDPPEDLAVEVVRLDPDSLMRQRWERFARPYSSLAHGPFAERLRELAPAADVVHLNRIEAGSLLPLIANPAVAQLDNLTRLDRDIPPPWTHEGRIAIELLRAERRTRRRARWLLTNSAEVARPLARDAPHAAVSVAPLALDPTTYVPLAPLAEPTAGLIGNARWLPTANAVTTLLTSVWPRVLERRPDARLRLAGKAMEPTNFPHLPTLPGVEWVGPVETAAAFLRTLGALLYPLARGSGAKVKVLEALALGVPVVTTPAGAEGIHGSGGIAVEESTDALANAACELLDDPARRHAAGAAAHERFQAHHSPSAAAIPVAALYEQMVESGPCIPR